jgi:hypothetical protein
MVNTVNETNIEYKIEALIIKSAEARLALDAMQYSQAALNAANALITMKNARKIETK